MNVGDTVRRDNLLGIVTRVNAGGKTCNVVWMNDQTEVVTRQASTVRVVTDSGTLTESETAALDFLRNQHIHKGEISQIQVRMDFLEFQLRGTRRLVAIVGCAGLLLLGALIFLALHGPPAPMHTE